MHSNAVKQRGAPKRISCDNDPEFVSCQLDQCAYCDKIELEVSWLGKPTDNALCESFNNRVRQEVLKPNWFLVIELHRSSARCSRAHTMTSPILHLRSANSGPRSNGVRTRLKNENAERVQGKTRTRGRCLAGTPCAILHRASRPSCREAATITRI